MPRSLVRDREAEASDRIFGKGVHAMNVARLARATKIPKSTLYDWKRRPGDMQLRAFGEIARKAELSDEAIIAVVRNIV